MAAPNIVNVQTITGTTTVSSGITTSGSVSVIVSNAANSNQVYKVNTLMASNTSATTVTITVKYFNQAAGAGSSANLVYAISIPTGSTLSVIAKDTPLYLPENSSLGAFAGTGQTNSIDIVSSYEVIS